MRIIVVIGGTVVSLGFFAKDTFLKNVCVADPKENDSDTDTFDAVQTVYENTLERAKSMPVQGGYNQRIYDSVVEAFEEAVVGDKFLCMEAFITDVMGKEVNIIREATKLVNEGLGLNEALYKAIDNV